MSAVNISWERIRENVGSTPTMVFSVVGDSENFVPRPWAKTVFQTALIEAAKSGGESWILYRGYSTGVSSIIREAYRNYGDMEFSVHAENEEDSYDEIKEKCAEQKKKKEDIKNIERHVKLIRIAGDQTEHDLSLPEYSDDTNAGEKFLTDFEKFISGRQVSFFSRKTNYKMPVPIAIIICEGDIKTIAHIAESLENEIPVIIIKGSGKAADLILDYLENGAILRKKASLLFGISFDDGSYNKMKENLDKVEEKKDLIGVFDVDNDDPLTLSNIVGEAVVSCWTMKTKGIGTTTLPVNATQEERKLENVLEDYKESSRPYVLNPKYASPTSLPLYFYFGYQLLQENKSLMDSGRILLLEAMKANRCDYVRVLLDHGVRLIHKDLPELYEQTVSCSDCKFEKDDCLHMQWILKQIEETHAKTLCHEYRNVKGNTEEINQLSISVANAAKGLCRKLLRYKGIKKDPKNNQTGPRIAEADVSISDLLLWAVFANRKELAEICWLRSEDHLLTGLVCSALLQKLANKANNVKEQILASELVEHSKLFEQRCIAIMDQMYEEKTQHAINLMDDATIVWGIRSSPLTFAYENFMYDVVAHTNSQKNMNKQWYNKLAPDLGPFLKSAFQKPTRFFTAPLTKYIYNYIMFFSMLVMYSAFVLTSISTEYYVQNIARVFEYYVYFWGAGDFIEELISCFGCLESGNRSHRGYYSRMKRYLYDFWNLVDLFSYALLISALFVRHFYPSDTFTIARRMFSLSLLVMYLRFLEVFLIHRRLGPTLIMIKEMLKDLFGFLFVALFIVIGVGIYYHANLWPDHQGMWDGDWTKWRIWKIIYFPYFQLYGELFNDFLEGKDLSDCSNITSVWQSDSSIERCPQEDWTVLGVSALYMLFSNLLLVNLVIAMFSYTFERVQENAEKLWRFERYTVINDYEWRIPSPINLIFLPYRFCCCPNRKGWCLYKCNRKCCSARVQQKEDENKEATSFRKDLQRITAFRIRNKL